MIVELYDVDDDIETGLWAHRTCPSFTGWVTIDGDHDDEYTTMYKFYFDQEQDAMVFLIRWQGQSDVHI